MDISSNNTNEEDMEDLPDLIPLDNVSPAASPFFANLLSQFEQQIPYTVNMDTFSLQLGQTPILSPIARRYYGRTIQRPINNHVINTHSWIQDGSAGTILPAAPPPTPLSVFPQPMFTTQTFPSNTIIYKIKNHLPHLQRARNISCISICSFPFLLYFF